MAKTYCLLLHVASTAVSGEGQKALPLSTQNANKFGSQVLDSEDISFSGLFYSFRNNAKNRKPFRSSSVDKENEQFFGCVIWR